MRSAAAALAFVVGSSTAGLALTLDDVRAKVTLLSSSRDPFRVRVRLGGIDPASLSSGPFSLRFGSLVATIPAGGLRRRGGTLTWRSGLFGVEKVTVRVKSSTLQITGGGVELGTLPGPVTLALESADALACGRIVWSGERVAGRGRRQSTRRTAAGPIDSCVPVQDGSDRIPPQVTITDPTGFDGIGVATPGIMIGGLALDAGGIAGLSWTSDRGGGGSIVPGAAWTIADVALAPGDNRITVSAVDPSGNTGSDVIDVTYNTNGIVFDGMPVADPDGLFVAQSDRVLVRQAIVANDDLDPESVQLERISDTGAATKVASMADDGDLGIGDEIQGDAVFTGKAVLHSMTPGIQRLRVSARTRSDPEAVAWSPVLSFPVVERVTQEELDDVVGLANRARDLLATLRADGASTADALGQIIGLALVRGARAAGVSAGERGAWWVDANGLLGGVLAYDQTTLRGGGTSPAPERAARWAPPAAEGASLQIGSRQAVVLAPAFAAEEPAAVDAMLRAATCPLYDVEMYTGAAAGAERFRNLDRYGLVLIAAHGETFFDDVGDVYLPEWGWGTIGAQALVVTSTLLTAENLEDWGHDLRLGRVAVLPDGQLAILPAFVTAYNRRFPSSIVYVGACRSSANITLASAFFGRGAVTYFGYDGYVESDFARDRGVDLFTKLLAGQTTGAAFTPGLVDGGTPPAAFTSSGRTDAVVTEGVVLNGGFETEAGLAGSVPAFTVTGDGRVVGGLGSEVPSEGTRMALISTGLGFTTSAGSIAQSVCLPPLPPGATMLRLSYDWNFFSEEFLEYCGSGFQDSFAVEFDGNVLQTTRIDDLCGSVTPADVSFDRGGVYKTGWQTQSIDVTAWAGTSGVLSFAAHDVGDSIFDSAILIDRVRVEAE